MILAVLTLLLSVGVAIECVASDWRVWGVAKVFTGMGNGLVQTQCVIYIAEVAPIGMRGALLASYALFYQLGGLTGAIGLHVLQTVSTAPFGYSHPSIPIENLLLRRQSANALDFRRIIYSQWIYTGIFVMCWPFMPETAWYHARRDSHDKAKLSLRKLYGDSFDVDRECECGERRAACGVRERILSR